MPGLNLFGVPQWGASIEAGDDGRGLPSSGVRGECGLSHATVRGALCCRPVFAPIGGIDDGEVHASCLRGFRLSVSTTAVAAMNVIARIIVQAGGFKLMRVMSKMVKARYRRMMARVRSGMMGPF